jgi:hypothetical protein
MNIHDHLLNVAAALDLLAEEWGLLREGVLESNDPQGNEEIEAGDETLTKALASFKVVWVYVDAQTDKEEEDTDAP